MSHFTYIKTRILNLEYLKKALIQLDIVPIKIIENQNNETAIELKIPQNNGYDILFKWNGQEYDLITDLSFWDQKWPIETFLERISQAYAYQTILEETNKQQFKFIKEKVNLDGSIKLILERWK